MYNERSTKNASCNLAANYRAKLIAKRVKISQSQLGA